jgi:hypothetical protein
MEGRIELSHMDRRERTLEREYSESSWSQLSPKPSLLPPYLHSLQFLQRAENTVIFGYCFLGIRVPYQHPGLIHGSRRGRVIHRAAKALWSPRTLRGHAIHPPVSQYPLLPDRGKSYSLYAYWI